MKKLSTILSLSLFFIFMTGGLVFAQKDPSKRTAEIQAPLEHAHYKKTWFREYISNLKKIKKYTKKKNNTPKIRKKRISKISKIRGDISKLSAKTEDE